MSAAVKHTPGPFVVKDGSYLRSKRGIGSDVRALIVARDAVSGTDLIVASVFDDHLDATHSIARKDADLLAAAPDLADALEKAADTLRDAATAYHLFGKHVAAEAMEIAERHSRETLRAAGRID